MKEKDENREAHRKKLSAAAPGCGHPVHDHARNNSKMASDDFGKYHAAHKRYGYCVRCERKTVSGHIWQQGVRVDSFYYGSLFCSGSGKCSPFNGNYMGTVGLTGSE